MTAPQSPLNSWEKQNPFLVQKVGPVNKKQIGQQTNTTDINILY
jgi:hypothetical protein